MGRLESFSQQIRSIATAVRTVSPSIRMVSQVSVRLTRAYEGDTFDAARAAILRWMAKRSGRRLPNEAWEGRSFVLEDIGAQYTAAVSLDDPKYWAARLDDADKSVPQRSWITEIGLARAPQGHVVLGTRLQCVARGDEVPFVPSVPGFVRQVADVASMDLDGREVDGSPWLVRTDEDVDAFVDLLVSPARRRDVIAFTLPPASEKPEDTVIPVERFMRSTLGAAHTVVITGPACFALTDRVGKEFSVYNQAVRTYRPGLNLDEDQPFAHPLALADRIRDREDEAESFEDQLIRQTLQDTITAQDLERELPSFATVRRLHDELQRAEAKESGARDTELLDMADGEIKRLEEDLTKLKTETDALLVQAENDIVLARAEREEAKQQFRSLRYRLDLLARRPAQAPRPEALPDSFENLQEWADENLAGAVFIHNRAIRNAKKSDFVNVALAYKALLLLRDWYVPMKREGGNELQQAFLKACAALGLNDSPTFAGAGYGQEGDDYFIQYAGKKKLLKKHLKGSNDRDPRYGFRLYYFWDKDTEQVIVGWLPSHLSNRFS